MGGERLMGEQDYYGHPLEGDDEGEGEIHISFTVQQHYMDGPMAERIVDEPKRKRKKKRGELGG